MRMSEMTDAYVKLDKVSKIYGTKEVKIVAVDEISFEIAKGEFVVMKTGTHPMRTKLRLFLDWGITFDPDGYRMPERAARKISYVNRDELARNIQNRRENSPYNTEDSK